jgi:hypothetical protein
MCTYDRSKRVVRLKRNSPELGSVTLRSPSPAVQNTSLPCIARATIPGILGFSCRTDCRRLSAFANANETSGLPERFATGVKGGYWGQPAATTSIEIIKEINIAWQHTRILPRIDERTRRYDGGKPCIVCTITGLQQGLQFDDLFLFLRGCAVEVRTTRCSVDARGRAYSLWVIRNPCARLLCFREATWRPPGGLTPESVEGLNSYWGSTFPRLCPSCVGHVGDC